MESTAEYIQTIDPFLTETGNLLLLGTIAHMGDKDDQSAGRHASQMTVSFNKNGFSAVSRGCDGR